MREDQPATQATGDDPKTRSNVKILIVGGIGGLAPLVATIALADADTLALYLEEQYPNAIYALPGYAVKVLALFAIGAFLGVASDSEMWHFRIQGLSAWVGRAGDDHGHGECKQSASQP